MAVNLKSQIKIETDIMAAPRHWLLNKAWHVIFSRLAAGGPNFCMDSQDVTFRETHVNKKIIKIPRSNETVRYLTYSDNILPHPIKTLVRQDILIGTPYFKMW